MVVSWPLTKENYVHRGGKTNLIMHISTLYIYIYIWLWFSKAGRIRYLPLSNYNSNIPLMSSVLHMHAHGMHTYPWIHFFQYKYLEVPFLLCHLLFTAIPINDVLPLSASSASSPTVFARTPGQPPSLRLFLQESKQDAFASDWTQWASLQSQATFFLSLFAGEDSLCTLLRYYGHTGLINLRVDLLSQEGSYNWQDCLIPS